MLSSVASPELPQVQLTEGPGWSQKIKIKWELR